MEPRHDKTQNQDVNDFSLSRPAGYGRDVDLGDRDESIALACCGHRSWCRARAAEEARDREHPLLNLLSRWRAEAEKQGHRITRIAVAFEAGHDGFSPGRASRLHVIHLWLGMTVAMVDCLS
jgi:hypothetical protein